MAHESIGKCEVDVRVALPSNTIIASGGSTLFSGFEERMQKEMEVLIGDIVKINAHKSRINCWWIEGSVVAFMTDVPDKCVTREQFKDTGQLLYAKN